MQVIYCIMQRCVPITVLFTRSCPLSYSNPVYASHLLYHAEMCNYNRFVYPVLPLSYSNPVYASHLLYHAEMCTYNRFVYPVLPPFVL